MSSKVVAWSKRIAAWRSGNESAAAFCRARGLAYSQFVYWSRRGAVAQRPSLLPVVADGARAASDDRMMELVLPTGVRLRAALALTEVAALGERIGHVTKGHLDAALASCQRTLTLRLGNSHPRTGCAAIKDWHRDRRHEVPGSCAAPIVSVSLGMPATFLFGGHERSDKASRIALHHGDVVVWGGEDRLRHHGVLPLKDQPNPLLGSQRINLTFRKAG